MTTGPDGQKRPADVIGNAGRVMRIAAGAEDDTFVQAGRLATPRCLAPRAGSNPQPIFQQLGLTYHPNC